MLRRLATLAILLAVGLSLAGGLAPAGALATSQDVASTHTYLLANYRFLRTVHTSEHTVNVNIARLNHVFATTCPRVGTGAPQNEQAQRMSYEVAGALWSTLYHTDANAVQKFLHAVKPLRWSNSVITHTAQGYVASLRELAALPMPNLCEDVRTWSVGGFRTLPASTAQFDSRLEAIEGKSVPSRLLAPYVQPGDKSLAVRAVRLETLLEHTETIVGLNDWDMLLETLALNQ